MVSESESLSLLCAHRDQTRHYLSPMINDGVTRLCVHTHTSLSCLMWASVLMEVRSMYSCMCTRRRGRRQRALQCSAAERAASHRSLSRRFVFARSPPHNDCVRRLLMILLRLVMENNDDANTHQSKSLVYQRRCFSNMKLACNYLFGLHWTSTACKVFIILNISDIHIVWPEVLLHRCLRKCQWLCFALHWW